VEIAFLIIKCHLGHSSVTYLSLLRLIRGQYPAYRATLLYFKRGGTKSRLVSLFLLESFLTKLISN